MNSLSSKKIFDSKKIRWVGIIAILGLALGACSPLTGTPSTTGTPGAVGSETPGASTTGTLAGTTATTSTVAPTTAATTAATSAPTGTPMATTAATATVGSGSVTGTPSGMSVNVAKTSTQINILVDSNGMTLYWFDKDTPNTSNCSTQCLAIWPPFLSTGSVSVATGSGLNASDFGTAQTADGKTMVTYRGYPLYYYSGDKNPGDINGYGVAGLWTVVAVPGPNASPNSTPAVTPTP
jgi:predicted lipoprotein with Yx(FWY)xxD motif